MEKLYVLYDPKCELCERLKDWLLVQRTWLGLCMVPAGSERAHKMFPELEQVATCNALGVGVAEALFCPNRAAGEGRFVPGGGWRGGPARAAIPPQGKRAHSPRPSC